jgi:hypothetical protein
MTDPVSLSTNPGNDVALDAQLPFAGASQLDHDVPPIGEQVADKAMSLKSQVKQKAFAAVDDQKAGLADHIDDFAQSLQKSGEQFQGKQAFIASAIERGASELSGVANMFRDKDMSDLLGDIRAFAARQPALFVGALFVAGFAVARMGKLVVADTTRDDLPTLPGTNRATR